MKNPTRHAATRKQTRLPTIQDWRRTSRKTEQDLLAGSKNTHIATLVERHSRFVMLIKVPSRNADRTVAALSKHVLHPTDSAALVEEPGTGAEMAKHKSFTVDTNVKVYFCDP